MDGSIAKSPTVESVFDTTSSSVVELDQTLSSSQSGLVHPQTAQNNSVSFPVDESAATLNPTNEVDSSYSLGQDYSSISSSADSESLVDLLNGSGSFDPEFERNQAADLTSESNIVLLEDTVLLDDTVAQSTGLLEDTVALKNTVSASNVLENPVLDNGVLQKPDLLDDTVHLKNESLHLREDNHQTTDHQLNEAGDEDVESEEIKREDAELADDVKECVERCVKAVEDVERNAKLQQEVDGEGVNQVKLDPEVAEETTVGQAPGEEVRQSYNVQIVNSKSAANCRTAIQDIRYMGTQELKKALKQDAIPPPPPRKTPKEDASLAAVKTEPDGNERTDQEVPNQAARLDSKAAAEEATGEGTVKKEGAELGDVNQANGGRDEEVAKDIETMRENIVEAMNDFQARIEEAKGIKLNLVNLLNNLSGIVSIDDLEQSIQKDLMRDLIDNKLKLRAAKNKIEYDHKLANEIKDWWAVSKASMIEKAQVDLTELIDGTSEISGQLLSETNEMMSTFKKFESTIRKKKKKRKKNNNANMFNDRFRFQSNNQMG